MGLFSKKKEIIQDENPTKIIYDQLYEIKNSYKKKLLIIGISLSVILILILGFDGNPPKFLYIIIVFLIIALVRSYWKRNDLNDEIQNKVKKFGDEDIDDEFDEHGYDKNGFDERGFDVDGTHKITGTWFDELGYDRHGYDKDGYDKNMNHRDGKVRPKNIKDEEWGEEGEF